MDMKIYSVNLPSSEPDVPCYTEREENPAKPEWSYEMS